MVLELRAMRDSLPESIDPQQQASRPEPLSGVWPADRCKRLGSEGRRVLEDVFLEARFTRHKAGRIEIDGRVRAAVELICQRCLRPLPWSVDETVNLTVVDERMSNADPPAPDVIELDKNGLIATGQWIEDEVLLRIPMVPVHAELQDCDPGMVERTREYDGKKEDADEENKPFSVLKDYF